MNAVFDNINSKRDLAGRLFLFCAWIAPTLIAAGCFSTWHDGILALLVAGGVAGGVCFCTIKRHKIICLVSLFLFPFTVWWCGATALGGAGPSFEAAMAVANTDTVEVAGAANYVFSLPSFCLAVGAHAVLLLLACFFTFRPKTSVWEQDAIGALFWTSLIFILIGICAYTPQKALSMGRSSSPLVSSVMLAIDAVKAREVVSFDPMHGKPYTKKPARAAFTATDPLLAVFIIGESNRADSIGPLKKDRGVWSAQLADRIDAGLGAWLPRTCASSNTTAASVPMLLTLTPADHFREQASKPTFLAMLKAAGFKTGWFANNSGGPDAMERGHDVYMTGRPQGLYMIQDVNPDVKSTDLLMNWKLDEEMIPPAAQFADNYAGQPRAMILHFLGSHSQYEWRYPAHLFPAEPTNMSSDELLELRYQRSVEYSVKNIMEVAALLDQTKDPAFLIFTSDHGENLPSDHNGLLTHGGRTSKKDGYTPSFVLWNKAFAQSRNLDAIKPLQLRSDIAHIDVAQLFLILAGTPEKKFKPAAAITWAREGIEATYHVARCGDLME